MPICSWGLAGKPEPSKLGSRRGSAAYALVDCELWSCPSFPKRGTSTGRSTSSGAPRPDSEGSPGTQAWQAGGPRANGTPRNGADTGKQCQMRQCSAFRRIVSYDLLAGRNGEIGWCTGIVASLWPHFPPFGLDPKRYGVDAPVASLQADKAKGLVHPTESVRLACRRQMLLPACLAITWGGRPITMVTPVSRYLVY